MKTYSIREAADYLGVSYTTVYNRIKTGKIIAEKKDLGRIEKYFIPAREIEFTGEVEEMRKIDKEIKDINCKIEDIKNDINMEKEDILMMQKEIERAEKDNIQKIRNNKSHRKNLEKGLKDSYKVISILKEDLAMAEKNLKEVKNEKINESLKDKARKRYEIDEEIEYHIREIRACVLKLRELDMDMRNIGDKIGIKFPKRQFTSMIEDYMGQVLSKVNKSPIGKFGRIVRTGKITDNDSMANYGKGN